VICGLGSLLLALSLIGSCGTASPTVPPEQPTSRIEPTHAPTAKPSPSRSEESRPVAGASSEEKASGRSSTVTGRGILAFSRETRTRTTDGMVMVYVPGGTFPMGSTEEDPAATLDELPQHMVTLDGFWIDQTEVTNAQFVQFLNEHGNIGLQRVKMIILDQGYTQISQVGDQFVTTEAALDLPVLMVTWHGAATYCQWAGGRLPTEAEWEYAARGPEGNIYPWGNDSPTCDLANYGDCSRVAVRVGSRPAGASWCGALDMAGNVWEWVSDRFGPYSSLPQEDPTGPASGKVPVLRGGGWHSPRWELRASYRQHEIPATGFNG